MAGFGAEGAVEKFGRYVSADERAANIAEHEALSRRLDAINARIDQMIWYLVGIVLTSGTGTLIAVFQMIHAK